MVGLEYENMSPECQKACIDFANWIKKQPINIVQDVKGPIYSSSYVGGPNYRVDDLLMIFMAGIPIEELDTFLKVQKSKKAAS